MSFTFSMATGSTCAGVLLPIPIDDHHRWSVLAGVGNVLSFRSLSTSESKRKWFPTHLHFKGTRRSSSPFPHPRGMGEEKTENRDTPGRRVRSPIEWNRRYRSGGSSGLSCPAKGKGGRKNPMETVRNGHERKGRRRARNERTQGKDEHRQD